MREVSVSGSESRGEWERLPPLSAAQLRLWEKALAPGPPDEVLSAHKQSNIDMLRCKMACLRSRDWLNDEVSIPEHVKQSGANEFCRLLLPVVNEKQVAVLLQRCRCGAGGPACLLMLLRASLQASPGG